MEDKINKVLNLRFTEFKDEIKIIFKEELKINNAKIVNEFQELKTAMEFLSHKYEEVVKENSIMKEEIKNIKNVNEEKTKQIKKLELDSQQLILKINDMENLSRQKNVEIHGVPNHQNENIDRIVMSLLKIADPNIEQKDIEESFRLKKFANSSSNKTKNSPILVKFGSTEKRMNVIQNRRKMAGFNFKDIGIDTQRVFINENLPSYSKALFYQANILKKDNGWKYIWTRSGTIKLRRSDESPVISVRDTNDLKKIAK